MYLTKHDGNGDNRFAILIEGTGTGASNSFEKDQYKYNIQEMGRIFTEHPNNLKPGPGYTGYYLQDHIYFVGIHNDFPYLERDKELKTKKDVIWAIQQIVNKCDSYDKVMIFYTGYGGKIGSYPYFDANNDDTIKSRDDIHAAEFNIYLNALECKELILILQPHYSGDWVSLLKSNQKNRIIMTSEASAEAEFDLCNDEIDNANERWVKYDSINEPDDEKFYSSNPVNYEYIAWDWANSENDKIYEIDSDDDDIIDFYENYEDLGSEFVSGLTEAYYIDRDYYYYDPVPSVQHHEPNDYLDADEDIDDNPPENTCGDENQYISCKESFQFMKNWNLPYQYHLNPWRDIPTIEYTWNKEGTMYIF